MGVFNRILQKEPKPPKAPEDPNTLTADWLTFETEGWTLTRHDHFLKSWTTDSEDLVEIEVTESPLSWDYDLSMDVDTIVERACDDNQRNPHLKGAGIISVQPLRFSKIEALEFILKCQSPLARQHGSRYGAILTLPFDSVHVWIKVLCDEYGTAGSREALVSLLSEKKLGTAWQEGLDKQEDPDSCEDSWDSIENRPVSVSSSDCEAFDGMTPEHPVSRARAIIHHIEDTVSFDERLFHIPPFRLGS